MYGHVPQYLDAERQRLRAERAEGLAARWRSAALILFVLLIAQTWLVVDTALLLRDANANLEETSQLRFDQEREVYVALQKAVDAEEASQAAERSFAVCKSANAGLLEGIREQQALLDEAIEHAKRCRT